MLCLNVYIYSSSYTWKDALRLNLLQQFYKNLNAESAYSNIKNEAWNSNCQTWYYIWRSQKASNRIAYWNAINQQQCLWHLLVFFLHNNEWYKMNNGNDTPGTYHYCYFNWTKGHFYLLQMFNENMILYVFPIVTPIKNYYIHNNYLGKRL